MEFYEWRGFLFVALSPETSFENQLGALISEIADEPMEAYKWVHEESLVFDKKWKIFTDNFIKGFHTSGVHLKFHSAIEFEKFETIALDGMVSLLHRPGRNYFTVVNGCGYGQIGPCPFLMAK